jgi:hypothetical protein
VDGLLDPPLLNMYTSHAQDGIAKVLLSSPAVLCDFVTKVEKARG